ncbi:kinetochore Sim4 complex subunit FTA2-domain-containing protein [Hypomontagnella submonticulosa]|nr:kinetochore Sim4 complex subunit FTA2-domain-containing protein [Hypomontagnella submonticulosa]
MADLIPDIRGPKLPPFRGDIENIQFKKLLSADREKYSSDNIPHSRVFQVTIEGSRYSLKVFNFFSLDELRPFRPGGDKLLTDNVVRHHLDPFYAECRAFGLLVENKMDDVLAVRCHGYAFLPATVERRIREQFGIDNWNRQPEDEGRPLRSIVKNYIRYKSAFGRKKFSAMRSNIKKLNDMGIYNMDIRKDNYLAGRLFDFSLAITSPHISLNLKLRTRKKIEEDARYDLVCFEKLAKGEEERREKQRASAKSQGFVRETRLQRRLR